MENYPENFMTPKKRNIKNVELFFKCPSAKAKANLELLHNSLYFLIVADFLN